MAEFIALTGPQQVGKTTAASSLVETKGFVYLAFADPIYAMIATLMEMEVSEVRRLDKNEPLEKLEGQTLRHALQTLGTEWGRNLIGQEVWLNNCIRRALWHVNDGHSVVVDDCRFLNEYEALKKSGARIVRLQREDVPEQVNVAHGSEVEWPKFNPDATVVNPSDGLSSWKKLAGSAILAALESRT